MARRNPRSGQKNVLKSSALNSQKGLYFVEIALVIIGAAYIIFMPSGKVFGIPTNWMLGSIQIIGAIALDVTVRRGKENSKKKLQGRGPRR